MRLGDRQQTFNAIGHFINRCNGHDIVVDFNRLYLTLFVTMLNKIFP